jgi:hypothetical protein
MVGPYSHTQGTEPHLPKYMGVVNIDSQYQKFGEKRGIIAVGIPDTAEFGIWTGAEWMTYNTFDWAFIEHQPHLRSGHVDITLMDIPHLTFKGGPHKGEILDSYVCTEQMLTAAFRAESLVRLVMPDRVGRATRERIEGLVEA